MPWTSTGASVRCRVHEALGPAETAATSTPGDLAAAAVATGPGPRPPAEVPAWVVCLSSPTVGQEVGDVAAPSARWGVTLQGTVAGSVAGPFITAPQPDQLADQLRPLSLEEEVVEEQGEGGEATRLLPDFLVPAWMRALCATGAAAGEHEDGPFLLPPVRCTVHRAHLPVARPLRTLQLQRMAPGMVPRSPDPWFPNHAAIQASHASRHAPACRDALTWATHALTRLHHRLLSPDDTVLAMRLLGHDVVFAITHMEPVVDLGAGQGVSPLLCLITPDTEICVEAGLHPPPAFPRTSNPGGTCHTIPRCFLPVLQELDLHALGRPTVGEIAEPIPPVLLCGPRRSGKSTLLTHHFCAASGPRARAVLRISILDYLAEKQRVEGSPDASATWHLTRSLLYRTFLQAMLCSPSVVLVQDMDVLAPGFGLQEAAEGTDVVADVLAFLALFRELPTATCSVLVVGETSTDLDKLPRALTHGGGFERVLLLPSLGAEDRRNVLESLLARNHPTASCLMGEDPDFAEVVTLTMGYVLGDLATVVAHASPQCGNAAPERPALLATLRSAIRAHQPMHLASGAGFRIRSDRRAWEALGGYAKLKQKLRLLTSWVRQPPTSALGIVPPRGILLYGPSGK